MATGLVVNYVVCILMGIFLREFELQIFIYCEEVLSNFYWDLSKIKRNCTISSVVCRKEGFKFGGK
jgi:hypothetical protein